MLLNIQFFLYLFFVFIKCNIDDPEYPSYEKIESKKSQCIIFIQKFALFKTEYITNYQKILFERLTNIQLCCLIQLSTDLNYIVKKNKIMNIEDIFNVHYIQASKEFMDIIKQYFEHYENLILSGQTDILKYNVFYENVLKYSEKFPDKNKNNISSLLGSILRLNYETFSFFIHEIQKRHAELYDAILYEETKFQCIENLVDLIGTVQKSSLYNSVCNLDLYKCFNNCEICLIKFIINEYEFLNFKIFKENIEIRAKTSPPCDQDYIMGKISQLKIRIENALYLYEKESTLSYCYQFNNMSDLDTVIKIDNNLLKLIHAMNCMEEFLVQVHKNNNVRNGDKDFLVLSTIIKNELVTKICRKYTQQLINHTTGLNKSYLYTSPTNNEQFLNIRVNIILKRINRIEGLISEL